MKIGLLFLGFAALDAETEAILAEAKAQCDYLMVGLQLDPAAIQHEQGTLAARYMAYKAYGLVDKLIPYASAQDQEDILRSYGVHIYFLHHDTIANFEGKGYCAAKGIVRVRLQTTASIDDLTPVPAL